jgi:hypothetical protein
MSMRRKLAVAVAGSISGTALAPASALAQAADPPAGGAALDQVIGASIAAMIFTAALIWLGAGHRSGHVSILGRLARLSQRSTGLPGWAALPATIAGGALIIALIGFLWDVSIHIDQGRDEGPFANPSHFLILAGLFGIFAAGFFACVLPLKRPSRSAVRIVGDWYAPLGGILLVACSTFALVGFPLDDMWHRLFGQDVTLWGPTHLMMIGGAAMSLIAIAVLLVEAQRANVASGHRELGFTQQLRRIALSGGLLIGLCVFPVEFDFGVPQFRFVFGPILLMLAAGVGLVATRVWLGPGAALGAVGFFLVIRGAVAVLVGPILGETTPHFALFVPAALAIEAAFFLLPRAGTLTRAIAAGVGLGTIGLAGEWAWSNVWMPIPWSSELLPEGALFGFASAMAGSLVGGWVGERLSSDWMPRARSTRNGAVVGAVAMFAIVGLALPKPAVEDVSAQVTLEEVAGGEERTVIPTVRFNPPDATEGAEFLNVTAWQGGGLVLAELKETGEPGTYRTDEPVPVHGTWKSLVRMSRGNTLSAIPIYLPEDAAIPAEEVPAPPEFEREFIADHKILQREQKDVPSWLSTVGYLTVASIALSLLILMAWALHRLALAAEGVRTPPPPSHGGAPAGVKGPPVGATS